MKKLLYCAAALAMAFFAGSCQRENLEPVVNGGVTYTISLPETVQTKGENGYAEYDLYYEVYKTLDPTGAQLLFQNNEPIVMTNEQPYDLVLDLLNDQDYTILFWANKKGEAWFDTQDLRNVKMVQSASNNEDRDAFCAKDQLTQHDGAKAKRIELKRPFAQVNIATLVNDVAYDINPISSLVKFTSIPVAFNVFTGEPVGEEVEVTYTVNIVPTGKLGSTDYKMVAMNYVLVPEGNIDAVYYEINTNNGTVKNTINNVPVKKNYRTNIIGNLLTSNATYTVELKPGFETPDEVVEIWDGTESAVPDYDEATKTWTIDNGAELSWLAAAVNKTLTKASEDEDVPAYSKDQKVVLSADIDLGGNEWTPIGRGSNHFTGTFDGAGHRISNFKITEKNDDRAALFGTISLNPTIKNLTVENVNIVYPGEGDYYGAGLVGTAYGVVTIENVTVKNSYISGNNKVAGILAHDGVMNTLTIDNCHVENCVIESLNQADGGNVGGLIGLFQTGGEQNIIKNSSVKNTVINAVNSSNSGKRSNGQFVACVNAKSGQVLTLENCVISGNTFTQNEGVTYVSPYGPFVGGDRESTGTANVNIKNCSYDVPVANIDELKDAITSAAGTVTIKFAADIAGNATIIQKVGVNLIIDGCGKKFDGTFYLEGGQQGNSPETLTFKNINFEHTSGAIDFISEDLKDVGKRYAHNVTVDNCTFTGSNDYNVVAMRYRQCFNMTVKNSTATALHSLMWTSGSTGITIDNVSVANCKNGVSAGTSSVVVKNSNFTVQAYGLRADGDNPSSLKVENTTINAMQPVIVRRMTKPYNVELVGECALNTSELYQVIFTNGEDDAAYVTPTGTYTITGADDLLVYPRDNYGDKVVDGLYKNQDTNTNTTTYNVTTAAGLKKLNEMFADKKAGKVVVLNLKDDIDFTGCTWTPVESHVDSGQSIAEINGNGHTLSNLTINGQAMFTRFAGSGDVVVKDITFDNANVNSNGTINTSILTVQTYQNVLLYNVDVMNSTIIGGYKVAPLIGTVYNENPSTITATLKNCDVVNVTVKATSYDFCTTGMVAFVNAGDNDSIEFEKCTVKNVKLYAPNVYTAHAAIYTTGSETLFNEAEGVTVENVTFENI